MTLCSSKAVWKMQSSSAESCTSLKIRYYITREEGENCYWLGNSFCHITLQFSSQLELHRPYHLPIPSLFCYGYSITDIFTQDQNTRSIYWNWPPLPKKAGQSYIGVAFWRYYIVESRLTKSNKCCLCTRVTNWDQSPGNRMKIQQLGGDSCNEAWRVRREGTENQQGSTLRTASMWWLRT